MAAKDSKEKASSGVKRHKTSKKYKCYKVVGDKVEKAKSCPKCGSAVFLARHKDRLYCGKCHYVEFTTKK